MGTAESGWTPLLAPVNLRERWYVSIEPWRRHRGRDDADDTDYDRPHDEHTESSVSGIDVAQADCCIAKAAYRVVLPATPTRSRPAELLLCGHHFRASQSTLRHANASAFDGREQLCEISD